LEEATRLVRSRISAPRALRASAAMSNYEHSCDLYETDIQVAAIYKDVSEAACQDLVRGSRSIILPEGHLFSRYSGKQ